MLSSVFFPFSPPSTLSKRAALSLLVGLGGLLAGGFLLDIYIDWVRQGNPLWSTLLENALPLLLALVPPYAGWCLYRGSHASAHLTEGARWSFYGGISMLLLAGLVVGLQVIVQEQLKPGLLVLQLATIGAVGGLLVGRSMGQRHASEQTAREEKNRLSNLFRGLPAPVVHGRFEDDRLIILAVNEAFEDVFGPEAATVEGMDLYDLVVPTNQRSEAIEIDRRALDEGTVEREVRRLTSDGPRTFRIRVATALDDGASETYAVYTDITDQKRRESELRLFQEVIEQMDDAVLVMAAPSTSAPGAPIVYANPAFEEMTGYRAEELTGQTLRVLQGPETDPETLDDMQEALEAGEAWSGETVSHRKDGTPFRLRWDVSPVRNGEGEIEYWVSVQRDVTETRRRKRTLRQQRNLLEQTQRLAGAWEVDLASGDMSWSEEVYRIHEVPPNTEVDVETGIEYYAPEVRPQIREAFERCVEEGESYDLELPLITAEGHRRWVRTVGGPVEDVDGTPVKVAGAFQDITQRKQAEEALREREARLRGLANSIPGVVYQFYASPDGTYGFHFVSKHADRVLGISSDSDDFFERFLERVPPSRRPAMVDSIDTAVEQGTPWRFEMPFEKPSGERAWLLGISMPEDREDEIVFNGVLLDITERKRQEQEAERRSTAMEAASDGMAILDDEGVYQYVNQAHADVYGYASPEAFLGNSWTMCYDGEELRRFEDDIMPTLFAGGQWRGTATGRRADGTSFPQDLTLTALDDGGIVCVVRDITDQIEREKALRQAKEEAEEASQLKSAMLANMSHELRTPLTSITGFSEVLKEELEGSHYDFASKVHESSLRLQRTLESVLHLSKLEAGVEGLGRDHLALGDVAEAVAAMLEEHAADKNLPVTVHTPDAPVQGHWNEDALRRICRNLLENAIKFTPEGGRIEIRVRDEQDAAVLEVEDTGIGMDPDQVPHLFGAFKQESQGMDREYGGSGLGLSIVKRLTEEMGGTIEVETQKGDGTCFTLRLPRTPPDSSN
ncbi:MAG: PAS domain S-box protein [Salinibacter sp.]|uniref:PAS domain-containing sensor histidine kinase n=1 Tax=Salinibacter sp. TaxID=2065818 RepID=UPI002FC38EA1